MSDIVKRIRESYGDEWPEIQEAADEIERLEKRLAPDCGWPHKTVEWVAGWHAGYFEGEKSGYDAAMDEREIERLV